MGKAVAACFSKTAIKRALYMNTLFVLIIFIIPLFCLAVCMVLVQYSYTVFSKDMLSFRKYTRIDNVSTLPVRL